MPRPKLRRLAAPVVLLLACSYDGSGLVSAGPPSSTSTSSTIDEPATTTTATAPPVATTEPELT